ncbi:MAG: hypothetical protein IKX54_01245 [Lachnospiraceae bacterium]|nr:hypothetical protein [Lachnospiraceae bacterium]
MNDNNEKLTIQNAIDSIEPKDGAKERMLENIRRKASQASQNTAASVPAAAGDESALLRIRRLARWALPVAACLTIIVVAAVKLGKRPTDEPTPVVPTGVVAGGGDDATPTMLPNPITQYDSAAELAAATGLTVDAPQGSTDVMYCSIGRDIAEVSFTVSDKQYTLRASKRTDDFSGLYGTLVSDEPLDRENGAALSEIADGSNIFRRARWIDGGICHILINTDGASKVAFIDVYKSVK